MAENDIPDVVRRWKERDPRLENDRAGKAFFVSKEEIAGNGWDLSINRYKQVVHEVVEHEAPKVILGRLRELEREIAAEMDALEGMLG